MEKRWFIYTNWQTERAGTARGCQPPASVVAEKVVGLKVVAEKVVDEKVVDEKVVAEKVVAEKVVAEKVVDEKVVGLGRSHKVGTQHVFHEIEDLRVYRPDCHQKFVIFSLTNST